MRVMGLDHGQARIGVAISDPTRTIARPLLVMPRRRKRKQDLADLTALAHTHECTCFVLGIPLDSDGSRGKKAREVEQFGDALREASGLVVHEWDERFSTVRAHDALSVMSVAGERRRGEVDRVAAAIILQDWLDAQRRERADDHDPEP
jgi:putative Holliday junction resolvase